MKTARSICTRLMHRFSSKTRKSQNFKIHYKEYLSLKIAGTGTLYRDYFLLIYKDGSWKLIKKNTEVEEVQKKLLNLLYFADIDRFYLPEYWEWIDQRLEDTFPKCLKTVKKRLNEIEIEIQKNKEKENE